MRQMRFMSLVTVLGLMLIGLTGVIAAQDATQGERIDTVALYESVAPSVVAITVYGSTEGAGMQPQGTGSGFVIDQDGHIVTNNHVVENADYIEVEFIDGTLARGEIIGLDPDSDLAVLNVDVNDDTLVPVAFGDSSMLSVGQTVFAIGSPFGQEWTMTEGIISGLQRTIRGLEQFSIGGVIQTDAAINPGNSGGPLLNTSGEVIGVNAQIQTRTGGNQGVGFAIPGNLTQRVARALIEQGFVNYSYLGIGGSDVSLPLLEAFDLANNQRGVFITRVEPDSPAARVGIAGAEGEQQFNDFIVPESFDLITAIDGTPVDGIAELIGYLARNTQPGDTVTLDVLRSNGNGTESLQFDVALLSRP